MVLFTIALGLYIIAIPYGMSTKGVREEAAREEQQRLKELQQQQRGY